MTRCLNSSNTIHYYIWISENNFKIFQYKIQPLHSPPPFWGIMIWFEITWIYPVWECFHTSYSFFGQMVFEKIYLCILNPMKKFNPPPLRHTWSRIDFMHDFMTKALQLLAVSKLQNYMYMSIKHLIILWTQVVGTNVLNY